jgi:hypothetical protein
MFKVHAEIDNINERDRVDYTLEQMLETPGTYKTKWKKFSYVMVFTRNTALMIRTDGKVEEFNPGQWRGQSFIRVSKVNITIRGYNECVPNM